MRFTFATLDNRAIQVIQFWMVVFIVTSVMSISYIIYSSSQQSHQSSTDTNGQKWKECEEILQQVIKERDSLAALAPTIESEYEIWGSDSLNGQAKIKIAGPFNSLLIANQWIAGHSGVEVQIVKIFR